MAGIPEHIIDQVRDKTDIAEVISRHIPLKKAGRNYRALCPFHHEKTPSFMVSPAKQIFHCFGCGAGGNVFNFLMKYERLEFPEAVRDLAQRAGVTIPVTAGPSHEKRSLSESLHRINETAAAFYRSNLLRLGGSATPRRYLETRKIGQQTIDRFKLGYAPKLWNGLLEYLKKRGFEESLLEKSGLIIKGRDGKYFDRFRDKIIFPICDTKGRIKGFGSRVLDASMPKYMNSPETSIYNKGSHLYGLNLSWEEIRDKNFAVVVEGYLDLLTPFKHNIRNVVASLGTALTQDQVRLIKRYASNVIILFDADQAGENAAIRSLDLLVEEDLKVKVMQLPKGYDPDNFINKHGPDKFRELLDGAQDIFDYKLNLLLTRYDHKGLEGKAQIASEMLPLISKIKNAILRAGYLKRLADTLSIDERDLRTELKNIRPDYTHRYRPQSRATRKAADSRMAEKMLTGLMLLEDELFIQCVKDNLTCDDFLDVYTKRIVKEIFEHQRMCRKITPSKLMDYFGDEKATVCISESVAICENLVDKRKSLEDCIKWIKQRALKERLMALCEEVRFAQDRGDDSTVKSLVIRYNDMMKNSKI